MARNALGRGLGALIREPEVAAAATAVPTIPTMSETRGSPPASGSSKSACPKSVQRLRRCISILPEPCSNLSSRYWRTRRKPAEDNTDPRA